jgi:two-component system LytT family sensor kinase
VKRATIACINAREKKCMRDSYNIKTGLIFSMIVALMAIVLPRVIRLDVNEPRTVFINFIYFFNGIFCYWLVHHFFLIHVTTGFFSHSAVKPVVSIFTSVVIISLLVYSLNVTNVVPINTKTGNKITNGQLVLVRLFRACIISSLTYFVVFYYRMQLVLQRSRVENEYLKKENLQAQLSSLKQQISPHFLFNSLNTLSSLSGEAVVKEYILKLSEVYRYVLCYQERKEVQVSDELEFIHAYLYILKSRFEEGITVNIQVQADKLQRRILPFSLQLLIENVFKHNSISYRYPLSIDIYDLNGSLVVKNDLRPRTTMEAASGTGLYNLSQRYRLTTGRDIVITRNASAFKVEIPFIS